MRGWPPISEPELLERLALDHDGFVAYLRRLAAAVGPREATDEALAHALGYPWARPGRSFLLRGGEVVLLSALDDPATLAAWTAARHPVVAFGSNASPDALRRKFGHFDAAEDRDVLVLAGALHDVDVGPAATVTLYGSMPGALFASPGTAVRAAVLWLTPAQVVQLTWSELTYAFGRLDRARFVADEPGVVVDDLFAYVARLGVFAPEGEPLALAAVAAEGRRARAVTQAEALELAAPLVLDRPDATADDLLRAVFADLADVLARAEARLWPLGIGLPDDAWTPYPAR